MDRPAGFARLKNVHWVKPKIVAEIKYVEFTPDMILRMPVFVRLRVDKKPKEATFKDQAFLVEILPIKIVIYKLENCSN